MTDEGPQLTEAAAVHAWSRPALKPLASKRPEIAENRWSSGPWEYRRSSTPDNTGGYDYAIVADGKIIAEVFEHVGFADGPGGYDSRPVHANARLIAAAPRLASVLTGLLAAYREHCTTPDDRLGEAVAALSEAEGKA